jgi:hypothetical protein
MSDASEADLLRILVSLAGRTAFPAAELRKIISPIDRGRDKAILAYNLCDGTRTQKEIASEAHIDIGQFSRMAKRWADAGVVHAMGTGKAERLLHVYRLSGEATANGDPA